MSKCLLCGKETEGSTGAAGIRWSQICQDCKDKEDRALAASMKGLAKVMDAILPSPQPSLPPPTHSDDNCSCTECLLRRWVGDLSQEVERLRGENERLNEALEGALR